MVNRKHLDKPLRASCHFDEAIFNCFDITGPRGVEKPDHDKGYESSVDSCNWWITLIGTLVGWVYRHNLKENGQLYRDIWNY